MSFANVIIRQRDYYIHHVHHDHQHQRIQITSHGLDLKFCIKMLQRSHRRTIKCFIWRLISGIPITVSYLLVISARHLDYEPTWEASDQSPHLLHLASTSTLC